MSLRNFFRLLRHDLPPDGRGVDHSVAKTAKDSLHITGRSGGSGASTSPAYKRVGEGHKNYAKSFKKKD